MDDQETFLVTPSKYLRTGIHVGMQIKSAHMENFIFKVRLDKIDGGQSKISIINLKKTDERIRIAAKMLSQYNPEEILVVCRRETGWASLKQFEKFTGIKVVTRRYTPGMMTNIKLPDFIESKIVLVSDVILDRNSILDANSIGIPVIGLCDTENNINFIDLVIPCNNKGSKSLAMVFFLIAKNYLSNRGIASDFVYEDFFQEV